MGRAGLIIRGLGAGIGSHGHQSAPNERTTMVGENGVLSVVSEPFSLDGVLAKRDVSLCS